MQLHLARPTNQQLPGNLQTDQGRFLVEKVPDKTVRQHKAPEKGETGERGEGQEGERGDALIRESSTWVPPPCAEYVAARESGKCSSGIRKVRAQRAAPEAETSNSLPQPGIL